MIQATVDKDSINLQNDVYVMLRDEMTSTVYKPLIYITSQLTNRSLGFLPTTANYDNETRYVKLSFFLTNTGINNIANRRDGLIGLGTSDLPFGFYNVKIYQNTDFNNVDVSAVDKVIYDTMMFVKTINNDSIKYEETTYKTDSPVFITNSLP